VAEARGAGLGRALTGKAIQEARTAGVQHVTLAVDARNRPARNLYTRFDFAQFDRREVYLALFPND
jgi:ribosomal protein S18 acetylase RimI-like enzyme